MHHLKGGVGQTIAVAPDFWYKMYILFFIECSAVKVSESFVVFQGAVGGRAEEGWETQIKNIFTTRQWESPWPNS